VNGESSRPLLQSAENPGSNYNREPTFGAIARDMDVMVPMRDGVKICVDVYHPDAPPSDLPTPRGEPMTWT
jgi:predicted acyl esterase